MNKRPAPPKRSRDELREEAYRLLQIRYPDQPSRAVDYLLNMLTGFDLEAIIAELRK